MAMEHVADVSTPESMFLPFLAMFASIYLLGYFIVFRSWAPRPRAEAASCFTSLFHGTPAALLALRAVLSRYRSAAGADDDGLLALLAAPNTTGEDLVLDFSTAYFAVDLAHYLVFLPDEALFVAHHLATLYVLATCRHAAAAGAQALMPLVVLAEATSAAQNAWTLAGMRCRDGSPLAARVHAALSAPFYAAYTAARAVLGPAWFVRMVRFLLRLVRRRRPRAGMGLGVVDGGDRRRDCGEHPLGRQPVAGILQGEEGMQKNQEQQTAMINSAAFPFIYFCETIYVYVPPDWMLLSCIRSTLTWRSVIWIFE